MSFESIKSFHLGNGIMQFENVLQIDEENLSSFIGDVETNGILQGYNKDDGRNEGGYEFSEGDFNEAPSRFVGLDGSLKTESGKKFLAEIKNGIYESLVRYCRVFPIVMSEVAWSTDGYVIRYSNNQNIGPHTDCALPYGPDGVTPINSFPLHNTLTAGLFLNENFEGGEIYYRPWDISAKPKAGSVLIYPSSFMGCHEVSPVTSGTRYAYLCWYGHGIPENAGTFRIPSLTKDVGESFMEQKVVPIGEVKAN